jgi:The (Largely Gram-negative Bacterial) Hydrophobe/Amphiphile Efflux-1 (HAE1) Family
MNLQKFIERPVLSTVISILIVILGIIGIISLPVSQYPDIAPPTIQVSTSYTGANAQTILKSVITPLEEQINGVEDMTYMTSTATNDGTGSITIYFKQGSDPNMAAINVQNRVTKATPLLPKEVVQVGVTTQKRQTSILIINTIYCENGEFDETFLQNYAKINILPKILRVTGVGDATVWGTRDYSMRIWLKPDLMSSYGLTPDDVIAALADQNIEAAPGKFGENGGQSFQYIMNYKGRLANVGEFENIIIRAGSNGQMLRLKDIARVELGALTYSIRTKAVGKPGLTFAVFQSPGSNATQVIKDVNKVIQEASKDFPPGVKTVNLMDTNEFLYASIDKVLETLLEAFILVFIVVYIFLQDFRSTIIPSISVPVAIVGTFFFLNLIGFSINLLTLFAMVLAIAIVVDDAIVVVEAVHAKLDSGYKSAKKASIHAMNEIAGAIVSITLVMASVFIPVTFIGGTSGVFYTQFGITLAIAIVLSAINALTLSPALCALFLRPKHLGKGDKRAIADRFHESFNTAFYVAREKYKGSVLFFINHRKLAFGVVVFSILLLGLLMKTTPKGLVPNEDLGVMYVTVTLPPATSLERTVSVLNKLDSIIAQNTLVETRSSIAGASIISGNGSTYGMIICKLKPWDKRKKRSQKIDRIIADILARSKDLTDAKITAFAPPTIRGFGVTGGFEFSLQDKKGGSLNDFFGIAQNFLEELNKRPEIQSALTTFNPRFPQYMVDVNVDKVKMAGLSVNDILTTLQGYYGGIYASNFNSYGKMYRVMVQADTSYRANEQTLNNIYIRNNNQMAPIKEFITLRRVYGPETIARFNLFTSIPIVGTPNEGYSSGDAIRAIQEVAAKTLPVGYGYELSGISREEQKSSNQVIYVFALCIIFIYFLLAAQYESYILPISIILSLPLGLIGSFFFAIMMGSSNNIYLQIALIMLIGLLAKNSILIVQFALARRRAGMSIAMAAVSGAAARLRPILMTSFALIIGLSPLMFASGVGANGNRSIGAGAIGGMLVGTILEIFIVPTLFVVFQALHERLAIKAHDEDDEV